MNTEGLLSFRIYHLLQMKAETLHKIMADYIQGFHVTFIIFFPGAVPTHFALITNSILRWLGGPSR